jgi:hypothetical protein
MLTQQPVGQPQNQHECMNAYMYAFIHAHKLPLNTLEFFLTPVDADELHISDAHPN